MLFTAQTQPRQGRRGILDRPQQKGPFNTKARDAFGILLRTLRAVLRRQQSYNQQDASCLTMDCDRYIRSGEVQILGPFVPF